MNLLDLAFNLLGLMGLTAVLAAWLRHRSPRRHLCLLGLVVIVLMAAALGLARDGFGVLRLYCWGLYVHLPLLLA